MYGSVCGTCVCVCLCVCYGEVIKAYEWIRLHWGVKDASLPQNRTATFVHVCDVHYIKCACMPVEKLAQYTRR